MYRKQDGFAAIYIEHEQNDLSFNCKVTADKMEKSNIQKAMKLSGISR